VPFGVAAAVLTGPNHVPAIEFVKAVVLHFVEGVFRSLHQAVAQNLPTKSAHSLVVERFVEHHRQGSRS
jgi:hypothetical protein